MQNKYILPDDIPGVVQELNKAKSLISSEKYKDASVLLDSVLKRVKELTIDKEFIDNKIVRLTFYSKINLHLRKLRRN